MTLLGGLVMYSLQPNSFLFRRPSDLPLAVPPRPPPLRHSIPYHSTVQRTFMRNRSCLSLMGQSTVLAGLVCCVPDCRKIDTAPW